VVLVGGWLTHTPPGESVPERNGSAHIQLMQCRFPGLAISNAEILFFFQIKYSEAISSNRTRTLSWFEITEMIIAVLKINLLCHLL